MVRIKRSKSGMRRDLFGEALAFRRDRRTVQEGVAATFRRVQAMRKKRNDPITEQQIADALGHIQQQSNKHANARAVYVKGARFFRKWWPPYPQVRLIKARPGAVKRLARMKIHKIKGK